MKLDTQILDHLEKHGPSHLSPLACALRADYDSVKRKCLALLRDGKLDRREVCVKQSRYVYTIGTGIDTRRQRTKKELLRLEARRERKEEQRSQVRIIDGKKVGPNGGRAYTNEDHHWSWGGQLDGYSPRSKSAILGE